MEVERKSEGFCRLDEKLYYSTYDLHRLVVDINRCHTISGCDNPFVEYRELLYLFELLRAEETEEL